MLFTRFPSIILSSFLLFIPVVSAQQPISRLRGFEMIWGGLLRPVEQRTNADIFRDLPRDAPGAIAVLYAESRGLIDEAGQFHPHDPLTLSDALVWLFRTRNIADAGDFSPQTLSGFLVRYPVAFIGNSASLGQGITEEQLAQLIQETDEQLRDEVHEVSLYSEKFHGKGTAFGEQFDMHDHTAAHKFLPHNTLIRVTNTGNGKSVIVRINDRGPYVKGRDMDLSLAAFEMIESRSRGVLHATFERLGDVTMVPACTGRSPRAQRIDRTTVLLPGVPHAMNVGGSITLSSHSPFVVRSVLYPDGTVSRFEQWQMPDESFEMKVGMEGHYGFRLSSKNGRTRTLWTEVMECGR